MFCFLLIQLKAFNKKHCKTNHLQKPCEERVELICIGLKHVRDGTEPTLCERSQTQNTGLKIHHATARDCGRRCHCQILHLKHHCHNLRAKTMSEKNKTENVCMVTQRRYNTESQKVANSRNSHTSESLMISPELRHSFLLSSRTVFMFSIHTASTGPSNMYHFFSWSMEAAPSRMRQDSIPSVL